MPLLPSTANLSPLILKFKCVETSFSHNVDVHGFSSAFKISLHFFKLYYYYCVCAHVCIICMCGTYATVKGQLCGVRVFLPPLYEFQTLNLSHQSCSTNPFLL